MKKSLILIICMVFCQVTNISYAENKEKIIVIQLNGLARKQGNELAWKLMMTALQQAYENGEYQKKY